MRGVFNMNIDKILDKLSRVMVDYEKTIKLATKQKEEIKHLLNQLEESFKAE